MGKAVPLLVTVDVEIAPDHDLDEQERVLDKLRVDLPQLPITWFCTAVAAEKFWLPLQRLAEVGHEIGCHGLDHSQADDYRYMTYDEAHQRIGEATGRIFQAVGRKPRSFRGPRMTTSSATLSALIAQGYQADFSGCAQRLDWFACGGSHPLWLLAPRGVYRPHRQNHFGRGEMPIRMVNLSSLGIPFLSGTLFLGGLEFMKGFFQILLAEARRTGQPIVYLFHTYEFARSLDTGTQPLHQRAYINDRSRRYEMTLALLNYMSAFPDVRPMTSNLFLKQQTS